MLSIQELGLSIMGEFPKHLYVLGGKEFGIKERYISILSDSIGSVAEFSTVSEVLDLFTQNHIIPLAPQVYVVRYDSAFVSSLNADMAYRILEMHIPGVLVLLYESEKEIKKLDKFFPDNTSIIDVVDSRHMVKYLKADFPSLSDKELTKVASLATDYYNAKTLCRCICSVSNTDMFHVEQLLPLLGIQNVGTETELQRCIAQRDFAGFNNVLDRYDGDKQNILYLILRTMGELDKCLDNKYADSPMKSFVDNWTRVDVYNMVSHTYNALVLLRSSGVVLIDDLLIYLSALLRFERVPAVEVL